jgi:lipoate-protein ligase A
MKVLDLTLPTPAENLACDEALLDAAESGAGGEVLRFWESPEYFVVVGYANKVATEVKTATCRAWEIAILRRCSGGGTVAQGPGCLNYALVLKIAEDRPTRNISSANQFIMERNRAATDSALRTPRSALQIQGHTDLAIGGLKFSGNSQRRRKNFLLFHGTFLLDFDLALVSELLHHPTQQPDYRGRRSHGEFITNLNLPRKDLKAALTEAWQAGDNSTDFPRYEIAKLVAEKYSTNDWNLRF